MSEQKVVEVKKTNGFAAVLDKRFRFSERGSTAGREIKAGLSVFFISVCALFMNIQILIDAYANDIPYCGLYLGATIIAFIGTLLVGIICNLPLVQTASLSLSTVMISMLGTSSGLTYANLLAVTFAAAIVYLIVMLIPALRSFIFHLIPESVRKALPAAMGLYIAAVALEKMGIIEGSSLASLSDQALGGATTSPYVRLCVFAGMIGFALVLFFKKRKSDTPVFSGFLVGTLIFFLIASVAGGIAFTYVFTQNRIWIGVNPDSLGEMYTIAQGLKELSVGAVFKEGFDFSAYTAAGGNTVWLFVQAVLMFLFLGMYESEASIQGADLNGTILEEQKYEKVTGSVLLINAVTNVIAPIIGAAPLSIGKQSAVATTDGSKTGLSSVVCAIGYFIAMFTWIPFVIFATYTKSVPEYGHAGFVFPNVIYATFQIADAVMLIIGLQMLKGFAKLKDAEVEYIASFTVTAVMTVFTQNICYGAAIGVIVYVLLKLVSLKKQEIQEIKVPQYVMAALSIVLLSAAFMTTPESTEAAVAVENSADASTVSESTGTNEAGFEFDGSTGEFSFTGEDTAEYYTVWVYAVDGEGVEGDSYVAASSRLSGNGEITGNVDISTLAYGSYNAKLNTFNKEGSNPEPSVVWFEVMGKLSTPEFMYSQDGTAVTVTLFSDTLTLYNDSEMFTDIEVYIYDKEGEIIKTEVITDDNLEAALMGPTTQYSCEKVIDVEPGEYQISLKAAGAEGIAETSDESEKIDLSVVEGAATENMTSGYVVQEEGMMP